MLDIERKIYECVRIGHIFVRVLEIRNDVGNGLVTVGVDHADHSLVLDHYASALPMGDVLWLAPDIKIEALKLVRNIDRDSRETTYRVRLGINAPKDVPIERDDMKKRKRPLSTAQDKN